MTLRVLSFGAGVQTTALAILNATGRIERPATDLVLADTGGEHPETYRYLREHFTPWALSHGLTLHTVSMPETLYDYSYLRQMVPSINTRWCTTMAKVRPINRWLKAQGATAKQPALMQIGISVDESHRAVDRGSPRYVRRWWPLVEMRLTRQDCHQIIREAGLPSPPKSGCWFCPYQGRAIWKRLQTEHPELAGDALKLEANALARNPRDFLSYIPLSHILGDSQQLDFDSLLENDQGCTSGACFL